MTMDGNSWSQMQRSLRGPDWRRRLAVEASAIDGRDSSQRRSVLSRLHPSGSMV